ncbi:MAG: hypothetical protein ACRCT1_11310 [Microcoleaceae cyanobacterium]
MVSIRYYIPWVQPIAIVNSSPLKTKYLKKSPQVGSIYFSIVARQRREFIHR